MQDEPAPGDPASEGASAMDTSGNTILITGGGSGIGRGLAEALMAAGNQVIIAGRRREALEETVAANRGMTFEVLDVADPVAIEGLAVRVMETHPALNVLINNAGIMRAENLLAQPFDLADAEATIITNLLGPIRLTAAFLPQLRRQAKAAVINVTSGLAFIPLAMTPTYCATKAALHSYCQSLRVQLSGTPVQVIELAPPAVATDLMPSSRSSPIAMPLDAYITESMAIWKANPEADEICVERVKPLRNAEASGQYAAVFNMLNPPRQVP
jgi:uncharacterized oxidoreductase